MLYRLDVRHRRRVEEQMQTALGNERSAEEIRALARGVYSHFGTMLAEFVRLPQINAAWVEEHVNWNGYDRLFRDLLAEGRGIIYATGHLGNWEAGGAIMAVAGLCSTAVARPLDNPLLEHYVNAIREACGQTILRKFGVIRSVVRALRRGQAIGLLVDQDAGRQGVFVPFFGKSASTIPTPADIAMRTGAPIIVAAMHRAEQPMKFIVRGQPPLWPSGERDRQAERLRLLTAINEHLASLIRQAPEQWLWLHRRWKTRPKEEGR